MATSDLAAVGWWLALQVLRALPLVGAYYLGKRAGRRAERPKQPRS